MAIDSPAKCVYLFDVDGVLVYPGGYRKAVEATMRYFLAGMGLEHLTPDERVPAWFEAYNVTIEWDMLSIGLAIVLNEVASRGPEWDRFEDLDALSRWLRTRSGHPEAVDYRAGIEALCAGLPAGQIPSEAVFEAVKAGTALPFLHGQPFVESLLINTRDVYHNAITRVFQNYVLGSATFEQVYGIPSPLPAESYLSRYDQPALLPGANGCLPTPVMAMAVYTARPSLPPRAATQPVDLLFSPEAEPALALVGLQDAPLIASGRMHYLAALTGNPPETFVKPSPVQALAAILAAALQDEWGAIQLAYRLYARQQDGAGLDTELLRGLPEKMRIHVFEDSSGGIAGVRQAAEILRDFSVETEVLGWGIAQEALKVERLHAIHVPVFPDINQALAAALAAG
ncbi:MAG: hypothetical protein VB089_03230 [Anaerolineaceae bacterium]|nr:hypothetical protein [Anaerolineaceae bacterium]